jgi:hypothetical protein
VRDLGLEVEREVGVAPPVAVDVAGERVDERECLRRAGFAVSSVGAPTEIPRPLHPWDYSRVFTILHDLMTASARTDLAGPAWDLRVLLLSECSQPRLHGIMFDATGVLPRQGSAVFVNAIRAAAASRPADMCVDADRAVVRTIVHELGHALNLAHRWEADVGRPDSTSFMNYPWRYAAGGPCGYWRDFRFTFDADELAFLRHGPRAAVRPGDAPFRSVAYWADGGAGVLPAVPDRPRDVLHLSLVAPSSGPDVVLGQPVFIEALLQNLGDEPVTVPADPLDVKTGVLALFIRRVTTDAPPVAADYHRFTPMTVACPDPAGTVTVGPHDLLSNNVNLTFGAGGFAFPEAGRYEIRPVLDLPDPWGVVPGRPLELRVVEPAGPADRRDLEVLMRPDVGAWFALGGADALGGAGDDLAGLTPRRLAANGPADPVVAAATRAAGLHAARGAVRFTAGRFHEREPDVDTAARLLDRLDDVALRTFDRQTAAATARLARELHRGGRGGN